MCERTLTSILVLFCFHFDGRCCRYQRRRCYGGHVESLLCHNDEWILVDDITLVEQKLSFDDAVSYCETEMNGQLWGDIDASHEELLVKMAFKCDLKIQSVAMYKLVQKRGEKI